MAASTRYVGRIVLSVNGVEVECESIKPSNDPKRQAVPTMNSKGRSRGSVDGIPEYTMTLTAPIPKTGDLDWENVVDAVLSVYDKRTGALIIQYYDVFTKKVGEDYGMEGAAKRDIDMEALDFRRF